MIERRAVLFRPRRLDGYLRAASRIGVPFYLSLPTYGYLVAYDGEGRFAALCGEGPLPAWPDGWRVHLVMSDPDEMARVVRSVREGAWPNCLGIAWFRLPVDTDRLNWAVRMQPETAVGVISFWLGLGE